VRGKVKKFVLGGVPKNRFGDRLFALLSFVFFHKRFPNRSSGLADVLHSMKCDGTLNDPLRVFISDKYFLKLFVSGTIGDEFVVPTIALLESREDVESFVAPKDCVVKPCHSSGYVDFIDKGSSVRYEDVERSMTENYYDVVREVNYKNLKRRMIVEPVLFGSKNIKDYKFFYFDGRFLFVQVDVDRMSEHKRSFYDSGFEYLGFSTKYPLSAPQDMPVNFSDMKDVAADLAKHFKGIIRIDLYSNGSEIKVGEITNCHGSAREVVLPQGKEVNLDDFL